MIIEDGHATFVIQLDGETTKQTYIGSFKVHCVLGAMEEIKAGKLYRELLGDSGKYATKREENAAFALSQLKYRMIEEAPFWENTILGGSHLKDLNIILHVLEKAVEAQEMYVKTQDEEYKERQARLTAMINKKKIVREDEVLNPHENQEEPAVEEVDLGE